MKFVPQAALTVAVFSHRLRGALLGVRYELLAAHEVRHGDVDAVVLSHGTVGWAVSFVPTKRQGRRGRRVSLWFSLPLTPTTLTMAMSDAIDTAS